MPGYLIDALFLLTGLMLLQVLAGLLPHVSHPAGRALLHAVMGLAALLMGNVAGRPFGLGIGLNTLTIPVCAGLGLPGTALLWALRYIL